MSQTALRKDETPMRVYKILRICEISSQFIGEDGNTIRGGAIETPGLHRGG